MYFAGVVATILVVPIISDRCFGRRWPFLISLVFFIVALLGLILSHNIYQTYVWMFILGACFAGRVVIGLTYFLEMMNPAMNKTVMTFFFLTEPVLLILLTFWYQFIDRSWVLVF
jgi:MFS family permease